MIFKKTFFKRETSVVRSAYCSFRGPEFSSQHPYQAAHNQLLIPAPGHPTTLLSSMGTSTHVHINKTKS